MVRGGGGVRKSRFTAGEKAVSQFTPVLKRSSSRFISIAVCLYHVSLDRDLIKHNPPICIDLCLVSGLQRYFYCYLNNLLNLVTIHETDINYSHFNQHFFTIARGTNPISCTPQIPSISQFTRTVACAQSEYTD